MGAMFGQRVMALKCENSVQEVVIKVATYNRMTARGGMILSKSDLDVKGD